MTDKGEKVAAPLLSVVDVPISVSDFKILSIKSKLRDKWQSNCGLGKLEHSSGHLYTTTGRKKFAIVI